MGFSALRTGIYVYAFPVAALTNYHKLGGFKTTETSQFWRQEVQNQGVSRDILSLKAPREDLSLLLLASDGSCA